MKEKKPSMDLLRQLCSEVRDDDGIDPREIKKGEERRPGTTARDRQLCAQVKRCLDLVLPEAMAARGSLFTEVLTVEPAPDSSRVSVVVSVDLAHLELAREMLPQIKGHLRNEVTQFVNRKKAPELAFTVIAGEEAFDE